MKQLQKNFTTPEQSKRLLELGVPADSADCAYRGPHMPITILLPDELYSDHEKAIHDLESKRDRREGRFQICEPCWSVGRLIEIFEICCPKYYFATEVEYDKSIIEQLIRDLQIYNADFSKLED